MAAKLGHDFLAEILRNGDLAVDGTMGNGHDTLLLAQLVGSQGKVYAFDIQEQAIDNTRQRLVSQNLFDQRVKLIHDGHQNIKHYIEHPIRAAIYNLGYLPGGDHGVITKTETTLIALEHTLNLLSSGGRMVIVVYPGHPGGQQEKEAVEQMVSQLDSLHYKVLKMTLVNRPPSAPGVVLIEKVRE
ncbi:putative rRNA methylase [Desulforamulus reducens MI-1]|uniref:Putative rRNA methylase n=2 Tax=Desulforamulus TaxID=2916693 RepID=A4J3G4_DESRM|nr:putative rRNA methylase [Desulforamulus reducens MI-1]